MCKEMRSRLRAADMIPQELCKLSADVLIRITLEHAADGIRCAGVTGIEVVLCAHAPTMRRSGLRVLDEYKQEVPLKVPRRDDGGVIGVVRGQGADLGREAIISKK